MSKKEYKRIKQEINPIGTDIPFSTLAAGGRIEMFGNSRLSFEGKYLILEYTESFIKIKTGKKNLTVMGNGLALSKVENTCFMLTGDILNLSFEN